MAEGLAIWVARPEARRACEVSITLDFKSTPIANALSVPPRIRLSEYEHIANDKESCVYQRMTDPAGD